MELLNLLYSSVAVIGSKSPVIDIVCRIQTKQYNNAQSTRDNPKLAKFNRSFGTKISAGEPWSFALKMAYLLRLGLRASSGSCWRGAARLRPCSSTAQQTEGIVRKEGEETGIERVTPDELVGRIYLW